MPLESAYQYNENLYGFYESIQPDAVHHKRSWLHQGIVIVLITLALVLVGAFFTVKNALQNGISTPGHEFNKDEKTSFKDTKLDTKNEKSEDKSELTNLDYECRKAENVDTEECKKWYDDLTKNRQSIDSKGVYTMTYDPNKPYDIDYSQFQYQVQQTPQFIGCVKWDGKYYAYTQQGTRLNVPQSDCQKYMNGDRPFNPFQQQNQYGGNYAQNNNTFNSSFGNQLSVDEVSKIEQAKSEGLI